MFAESREGDRKLRITTIDYVMAPLFYQSNELNKMYDHFLEFDGLTVPNDAQFFVRRDPRSTDGVLLLYRFNDEVRDTDPDFNRHRRLARVMMKELSTSIPDSIDWVVWSAGIDSTYRFERFKKDIANRRDLGAMRYILPQLEPEETLPEPSGQGNELYEITAQKYAAHLLQPAVADIRTAYRPYLDLSGLEWGRDASVTIEPWKINSDFILITLIMSDKTERSDPDFSYHKSFADRIVTYLRKMIEPEPPSWLRFRVAADTSGGRIAPVILK